MKNIKKNFYKRNIQMKEEVTGKYKKKYSKLARGGNKNLQTRKLINAKVKKKFENYIK